MKVLELPGLADGGDVSDWLDSGRTVAELEKLAQEAPQWKPRPETVDIPLASEPGTEEAENERKPSQAELLIRCAEGADLFHSPAGDSYATVSVHDHRETHLVKAKGFRRWLVRTYFEKYGRPPGNQALQDALGLLEARAEFDGPQREVYVRVAEHSGHVYVDLANEDWQVVEITPAGWRVVAGEGAPVRFRRPRGMLALPTPGRRADGADSLLRRFFNVSSDEDLRLIVAWLVAALRPAGPYPILLFQGGQGTAKTTNERVVRALVDPSAAPLRTTPRSEHDLFIAADNAHVVALDNISSLQPWLSDALCRLSTGGGFLELLTHYIVTTRHAKHLIFARFGIEVVPDSALIVFAREDDYFFGVLHSRAHKLWARRMGTYIGVGNDLRYTPTSCFETFPLPWPPGEEPVGDPRVKAIAEAARRLEGLRCNWLNPKGATEAELKKRTLTNLYNARPAWLDNAHRKLDQTVFNAYGWPEELEDEEILAQLLSLNLDRRKAAVR